MGECFRNLADFLAFRGSFGILIGNEWGKALLPTFARPYDDSKPMQNLLRAWHVALRSCGMIL